MLGCTHVCGDSLTVKFVSRFKRTSGSCFYILVRLVTLALIIACFNLNCSPNRRTLFVAFYIYLKGPFNKLPHIYIYIINTH